MGAADASYSFTISAPEGMTTRILTEGVYTLGSSIVNDIIIKALDVPLAGTLTLASDGISFEPSWNGFQLSDGELEPNRTHWFTDGLVLDAGQVRLTITPPAKGAAATAAKVGRAWELARSRVASVSKQGHSAWLDLASTNQAASIRRRYGHSLPAALLGFGGVLMLLAGWMSLEGPPRFDLPANARVAGNSRGMLEEAYRRLSAADLSGRVVPTVVADRLVLAGEIAVEQSEQYQAVHRHLGARFPGAVTDSVTVNLGGRNQQIEAVVFGNRPGVVTRGGRITRVGEASPAGWIVKSISRDSVELELNGVRHQVKLPGNAYQVGLRGSAP